MDINQKDRAALRAKRCPDCGRSIRHYFFEPSFPWCNTCDVWFEVDRSGWVIRNVDATKQYNQAWRNIIHHEDGYFA